MKEESLGLFDEKKGSILRLTLIINDIANVLIMFFIKSIFKTRKINI